MIISEIEVLWIARYDYSPGLKLEKHKHDYYQIIYVLDGSGSHYLNDDRYTFSADQLFLIKPGEYHGLIHDNEISIKTLDVKFQVHSLSLKAKLQELPCRIGCAEQKIKGLLENIRMEGLEKRTDYKELSSLYLYQILLKLSRLYKEQVPLPEQLTGQEEEIISNTLSDRVINYMKSNYSRPLQLDDIASFLGYNKNYLCEVFKKETGSTLIRYLYSLRIEKAKELILYSDYSLKEIAKLTGFESIHHFTKLFHLQENITPGQWRNKEKEGVRKDIYISDTFVNINNTQRLK